MNMKIKTWYPGMPEKETSDLAYWERNMLALHFAEGWYNDDITIFDDDANDPKVLIKSPCLEGWRRVITLDGGKITFHIPDDFDVGDLPEVERNWDGHTTEEKWRRILSAKGCAV